MHGISQRVNVPDHLGTIDQLQKGKMILNIRENKARLYSLKSQMIPIHDFINFKDMSSNEILINLENHENFTHSELVGGLIELSSRDQVESFDWNEHPITAVAIADLKSRQPNLGPKHIAQTQMILTRLRIRDEQFWQLNAVHTLRQLHKFKARDMAQFLDLYDRDVLDEMGEAVIINKCEDVFFERIVGLLPMFIKEMTDKNVIRCLEVITKKGLGSQRLFDDYILMMIEKNLLHYPVHLYARMV